MNRIHRFVAGRCGWILLHGTALAAWSGCAAQVYSEPGPAGVQEAQVEGDADAIVYVDAVPPDIEEYPHSSYGGGEVYFVEGRWYRRGPRGWGYFRAEPPQLARQRPIMVEQARERNVSRERTERPSGPVAPRERAAEPQVAAPAFPHEHSDGDRTAAPAGERAHERPTETQAPAANGAPSHGTGGVPPRPNEAPKRARPTEKRPAPPKEPPKEHER